MTASSGLFLRCGPSRRSDLCAQRSASVARRCARALARTGASAQALRGFPREYAVHALRVTPLEEGAPAHDVLVHVRADAIRRAEAREYLVRLSLPI